MNKLYLDLLHEEKTTLIMSLPANNPEWARVAWENGADVVKVHMNVHHHASNTHFGSYEEEKSALTQILNESQGPCGIVAGGDLQSALRDYKVAAALGFEFVSLYAKHTSVEILESDCIKKMIALDNHYTSEEVRFLDKIGADVLEASIMDPDTYGEPLSATELLRYASICETTNLPVVIPTQRYIQPEELHALVKCGVKGIMIGAVVTGKTADSIAKSVAAFRHAIDCM